MMINKFIINILDDESKVYDNCVGDTNCDCHGEACYCITD